MSSNSTSISSLRILRSLAVDALRISSCAYYEKQDKNWTSDYKVMVWGDGDSLDRERVRDILLDEYNLEIKEWN